MPDPSGFAGMLDGFWDSPMITSIAFVPRNFPAEHMNVTSGPIRDGVFAVDGADIAYRFYMPPEDVQVEAVVYSFHGNAEVCSTLDPIAHVFHSVKAAVLSVDFRGFSWGTGTPALTKLCPDAEQCFISSERVLEAAGCAHVPRVAFGRSIGATCAVHLAATFASKVQGLVVESGLMSIKQLPVVGMFGQQALGPQANDILKVLQEPLNTLAKLRAVGCPTLVMHGALDNIVPIEQGVWCYEQCASQTKHLKRWDHAGHNDIGLLCATEWTEEVKALIGSAKVHTNDFPAGVVVEAHSLSAADLNGQRGKVLGPQGDRYRVAFSEPHGEKALKPTNLKVVEG